MKPNLLADPVLTGRKHELKQLEELLNVAIKGNGTTVFISGEAGSGKTRLLTEFLNTAKKKQLIILTGWCLSDAAIPYFPFQEAFGSYFSSNNQDNIEQLTNEEMGLKSWLKTDRQTEHISSTSPQIWRDQAFGMVTKELLLLSAKKPLILALEDIQWADSASLSLLHYLARQIRTERILIVATFRSEESPSYSYTLSKLLLLMGRDDLYTEVKLGNLNPTDVRLIAENMLSGKVRQEFAERLASETLGNPLFVVESLRMLYQQGSLSRNNGEWSLCQANFQLPKKVKDVVLQLLQSLNRDQRIILDIASISGEKFDPSLISAVLGHDKIEVLRALNEAAKSTLMIDFIANVYRFRHAKFREMLFKEIPPPLQKEYHLRLAEKIEATRQNVDEISAADLAYHFTQGQNREKAIKYSLQSGQFALSHFSNSEAISNFTFVIDAAGGDREFAHEKLVAMEGLGDAFNNANMFKDAIKTFELLSTLATGQVKLRALRKAMFSAFQYGDVTRLKEFQQKAGSYALDDRLENARVLFNQGRIFSIQSIGPNALESFESALQVFEEEYALKDVALALMGVGARHPGLGKPKEGIAECLRAIALLKEAGDFSNQLGAYYNAGFIFNMCLLEDKALEMFDKVLETNHKLKMNDYIYLVFANAFSCKSLMQLGKFDASLPYALKALDVSKKTHPTIAHAVVYALLTRLYARPNSPSNAKKFYDKLIKPPKEVLDHPYTRALLTKAVYAALKNRWQEADQYFNETLAVFKVYSGAFGNLVEAKLFLSWALEQQGRFEESKVPLQEVERLRQEGAERFSHVDLRANLMSLTRVLCGKSFEVRIDIVNVSKVKGFLVRIDNVLPPELELKSFPEYAYANNSLSVKKELLPFEVTTIKLELEARKPGGFTLAPQLAYTDEVGKTRMLNLNMIKVKAQSETAQVSETYQKEKIEIPAAYTGFQFSDKHAEKAFDYLVDAFVEDYMRRRLSMEGAGWRTLMQVVSGGKLPKSAMYGFRGRKGKALVELESRGLVEARFFGERGRGGKISKLRVSYHKEPIKEEVDNRIVGKKKG